MTQERAYRVGTRVALTRQPQLDEAAVVLERIDRVPASSSTHFASADSTVSGRGGLPYWYRVELAGSGQELLVCHGDLRPTFGTEYD